MSAEFSLIDLIPEPLHFRDTKPCEACAGVGCEACAMRGSVLGQRYDAKRTAMFGPIDQANCQRLYREMLDAVAVMQRKGAKDEELANASATLESVLDELMHVIVPDLPTERIAQIASQYKMHFINWWREQQPAPAEPSGPKRVARGRTPAQRSRASSSKATTPRAS